MHIYNVSTKIDFVIEESWKKWMLEEHIPQVMGTNCFVKYQFVRVMDDEDKDGAVYAISYYFNNLDQFENYLANFADTLRKETLGKWGNQMIAFRSLLEVIE
ncbi:DUF4286 family protein [Gynurincola endophyticus]|jgi:hypothetical protein|uniref:DUF4286 family protein n=1 Tax=Gynurincola endophyticus TaxID=2479004 RepID=UPI000F8C6023|nr:DUF4286 family protein [Gynurincola endophyticus]